MVHIIGRIVGDHLDIAVQSSGTCGEVSSGGETEYSDFTGERISCMSDQSQHLYSSQGIEESVRIFSWRHAILQYGGMKPQLVEFFRHRSALMIGAEDISAAWENQYQSGIWFIIKQKEFEIRFKIAVNGGIFLPQRQSVICLTHYKSSCSIVFNPSILFFRINFAPLFEVILNKTDNLLEFLFAVAGHFDWFAEGKAYGSVAVYRAHIAQNFSVADKIGFECEW